MMHKKYLFLSALGHLLIIVSAALYFAMKINNAESNHMVSTYVYSTATKSASTANDRQTSEREKIDNRGAHPPIPRIERKKVSEVNHEKVTKSTGSQSQLYQEKNLSPATRNKTVLQLLHSAIAAKQIYPDISVELHESGTVKLGFLLSPDGQLNNVSVINSSGFSNIDTAALNAVNASSPVKTAGSYLQHQEYFTVDVVFR